MKKPVVGSRKSAISGQLSALGIRRHGIMSRNYVFSPASCLLPLLFVILFLGSFNAAFSQSRMELSAKLFQNMNQTELSKPFTAERKSPALAAIASFVVPGLGELYAGRYDVGKYSTIAEVTLWAFYTATQLYSDQVRNDAINYAKIYAGADVSGKSSQFLVNIGNFLNTQDYNIKKIHDGDYGNLYSSASYQWQWQSDAERGRFKALRIKADEYLNYGRYTAAVIILNHLVSAIDAARLTANFNASATSSLNNTPGTEGIYLNLAASF
ncbi:MAG: hypothetical protein M1395_10015 [Bacteroidetes bacterium]|nr:hypothetical protein [Bacteroidota bacterium]